MGKELFQYIVMGIYTPLIISAFRLYVWCAAADPADPGVFKSKKYLKILDNNKHVRLKDSKLGGESASSIPDANAVAAGENCDKNSKDAYSVTDPTAEMEMQVSSPQMTCFTALLALLPCAFISNCSRSEESPEQQMSEDGMFYCSLCEVEVNYTRKHEF